MLEKKLIQILNTHEHFMRDLTLVQELMLPNWYIAAGYVRNFVWDQLHGYRVPTASNDVDILYYDPDDLREATEKTYESILKQQVSSYNWSVKNQARMHLRNHSQAYSSVSDAMKRWPETATAVGVSLKPNNELEIIAPHGLGDLFELVVRRSPYFDNTEYFYERVISKRWLEIWPKLRLVGDREEQNT